jgi:nicotinamide phosphoribosyltransferase
MTAPATGLLQGPLLFYNPGLIRYNECVTRTISLKETTRMRTYRTPWTVNADLYQVGHFEMIPPGMENFQCSQAIFRKPLHYGGDERADNRLLSAGTQPFIDLCLNDPLTMADVKQSVDFYSQFRAMPRAPYAAPYPFPEAIFKEVVNKHGGILPVVIQALPDGQAHYVGEVHAQVWTDVPGMGELVGWIESSLLPYLWVLSIVATRGRVRKDAYIDEYAKVYKGKSRDELHQMVAYKFHDFGRRGGAATQLSGIAHLMNWLGTDTADAAYVAQYMLNNGEPFGACSVPAAAHRTVTPWPQEIDSYRNAIEKFGDGILSIVSDSYNYTKGMEMLGSFAKVIKTKGGFLVGRPDSGDPVATVLEGLQIFEAAFGLDEAQTNEAGGLKVLANSSVLQGDGVSDRMLFEQLFPAIRAAGYSPINLVIGMGEYNHRAVRSDTEEGYKTALVGSEMLGSGIKLVDAPGPRAYLGDPRYRMTMKYSKNDWKKSCPCPVVMDFSGVDKGDFKSRVMPATVDQLQDNQCGELKTFFDGRGKIKNTWRERFTGTRDRSWASWESLPQVVADTYSPEIRRMQETYRETVLAPAGYGD